MENQGIDPCASCMLSTRSTIWARPPVLEVDTNVHQKTTSQRFELWRAEPNSFLNYLLNHSDMMSLLMLYLKFK